MKKVNYAASLDGNIARKKINKQTKDFSLLFKFSHKITKVLMMQCLQLLRRKIDHQSRGI